MFGEDGKHVAKYLINHVEFNAFWRENAEMAFQIVDKALGKQGFQNAKARTDETFKILGENKVLPGRKLCCKIPYKT